MDRMRKEAQDAHTEFRDAAGDNECQYNPAYAKPRGITKRYGKVASKTPRPAVKVKIRPVM